MRLWIDPPSGWKYGFPKIYDNQNDGPLEVWLKDNGYPLEEMSYYVRSWPVEEVSNCETTETEIGIREEGSSQPNCEKGTI